MRWIAVAACCLIVGCGLCGNPIVPQSPDRLPFPAEITVEWIGTGAEATWARETLADPQEIWSDDDFEIPVQLLENVDPSAVGEQEWYLPGFMLSSLPENFDSLTEPNQEFCLYLNWGGHDLTAADLNRLNRFQNLVALCVFAGGIDADEQSLQLPNLRVLSVTGKPSAQFWTQAARLPRLEHVMSPGFSKRQELEPFVGKGLKSLSFYPDEFDVDSYLAWLACLRPQRSLNVPLKTLEPRFLDWLAIQTQLEGMEISYPKVTDADLKVVGQLPNLAQLHLAEGDMCNRQSGWENKWKNWPPPEKQPVPFTPEGFRTAFAGRKFSSLQLPNLTAQESAWFAVELDFEEPWEELYVHRDITDEDLALLSGQQQLLRLVLNCEHITDAGLVHLEKLSNLKTLDLDYIENPRTTAEGIERLKAKLPDLEVWGGIPEPAVPISTGQ